MLELNTKKPSLIDLGRVIGFSFFPLMLLIFVDSRFDIAWFVYDAIRVCMLVVILICIFGAINRKIVGRFASLGRRRVLLVLASASTFTLAAFQDSNYGTLGTIVFLFAFIMGVIILGIVIVDVLWRQAL